MGQICFQTTPLTDVEQPRLRRLYMTGIEGIAWERDVSFSGDRIIVDRSTHESGRLFVPWQRPDGVEVVLSTTHLREQDAVYQLDVELARGTLNRVRNYLANRTLQLTLSRSNQALLSQAHDAFMNAILSGTDLQAVQCSAAESILFSQQLIKSLMIEDAGHLEEMRYQTGGVKPLFGTCLDAVPESENARQQLIDSFDTFTIPFNWQQLSPDTDKFDFTETDRLIQWAQQQQKKIIAGPLVRLDDKSIPEWMYLWESDFTAFQMYLTNYVQQVIQRYRGEVHVWHCGAGLNSTTGLRFSEEQIVRISVDVIETIRRLDATTPVVISFDLPWGEYAADRRTDLSPLQFAEALVRGDVGINGVGLELNFGNGANDCCVRDLLEINSLLTQWSRLLMPQVLSVSAPTSPVQPTDDPSCQTLDVEEVAELLQILVSHSATQGVLWNQLHDAPPRQSGILTQDGLAKPLLDEIQQLRQEQNGIGSG